jgi:transmembrane sensor
MTDPARELERLMERADERWDAARTERTLPGVHHKRRRRAWRRGATVLSAVASLCALAWFAQSHQPVQPPVLAPREASLPPLARTLVDGSKIFLRDGASELHSHAESASLVSLELVRGAARFDVVPAQRRRFRVQAGAVVVEVLGTAFDVEREGGRTRVAVERGRVAVRWSNQSAELAAGEAGWFPRADETPAEIHAAPKTTLRARELRREATRAAHESWREPAERGEFDRAYELLRDAPQKVADDVEELMLAADTARLSGHPDAALAYLRKVVAEHPHDSRASLAAFTLGGVLMQQLGQPREAEAAYARARELSLNASLAEDALARQVEAAHRAGDGAQARALAAEYVRRYPDGRRVRAVRRFGNLAP